MIDSTHPLTIAVTGINAIDSPGPGIAVIRALREGLQIPLRIIGLCYETLEPGIYMHDVVDKTYQIPYPGAGREALMNRLRYIHEKEQLGVIIPNFDAELFNFIKLVPALSEMGIATFLPTAQQFESRDKVNLYEFGKKHDLSVPEDKIIFRADELFAAAEQLHYPLVVKGKFYDAIISHTYDEAQKAFYRLSAKWGVPVIVQKFIPGTEINIAVLGDGEGNAISIIPMRKLYITDKGKAWAGITLEDEKLVAVAKKFVTATKWKGGCELEIMRNQDDELFIMEINPRFPAWIYLSAAAGQNQPSTLVKMALGEKVNSFEKYQAGKMFIRYSWDLVTDVSEFQGISGYGEL